MIRFLFSTPGHGRSGTAISRGKKNSSGGGRTRPETVVVSQTRRSERTYDADLRTGRKPSVFEASKRQGSFHVSILYGNAGSGSRF